MRLRGEAGHIRDALSQIAAELVAAQAASRHAVEEAAQCYLDAIRIQSSPRPPRSGLTLVHPRVG